MKARLADPQQRAILREQQRQAIAENHYGVADALQLDAATFDRLIGLLADQQLEQSDYYHNMFANPGAVRDPKERLREKVERLTQELDALREVLGQEKLERYQSLLHSLGQRRQIREFDERLGVADKLNGTQRERMVQLLHDHVASLMQQRHTFNFGRSTYSGGPSREERQRRAQLQSIASDEELWRAMPEANRRLRERAAEFLTEPQLARLAQLHAEQATTMQQGIEQMRMEAGLSPTIPAPAEVTEEPPAIVNRDLKLTLKVAVNSESPRFLTTVVSGGKLVSLKIAEGLFLEATPIAFDNDYYNLQLQYFETGVTGKRLIGSSSQSGMLVRASQEARSHLPGGVGGTLLAGSKAYAVELSALVEGT